MTEKEQIIQFLSENPCSECQGEMKTSGIVYYTDPLQWLCACTKCGRKGIVTGPSDIDIIDLPEDKIAEARSIEDAEEQRAFMKKHGVIRPKNTTLRMI